MRPIRRGPPPSGGQFEKYRDAFRPLAKALGLYCSYCERRLNTGLAVEHIQPKALPRYAHLERVWENFLLGCMNCNSTKLDKDVPLDSALLPDRDNTFLAFDYLEDGSIHPAKGLSAKKKLLAEGAIRLVGLNKKPAAITDPNLRALALERHGQRLQTWLMAIDARNDIAADPGNEAVRKWVLQTALERGFFSIWMAVFQKDTAMRNRLIDAFPGTRASGCFDTEGNPVSPSPNPDDLPHGGKI